MRTADEFVPLKLATSNEFHGASARAPLRARQSRPSFSRRRSALASMGHNAEHWQSLVAARREPPRALGMTKAECDALHATAWALYQSQDLGRCRAGCRVRGRVRPRATAATPTLRAPACKSLAKARWPPGCTRRRLENDGANGAAAFRLGQCLRDMGKRAEARAAFELSLDIARSDESMRAVQDAALAAFQLLKEPRACAERRSSRWRRQ